MPEKLDSFPKQRKSKTPGRWSKYNWKKLLNGDAWLMVQGEDYNCTTHGFLTTAHQAANRRGGNLRTRLPNGSGGDRIIIQFQQEAQNGDS